MLAASRSIPLALVALLAACRPDAGTPIYAHADDFNGTEIGEPEPVVGSDPYEPGESRLSLGIFYEGGFSEEVAIDDESTHFYIYGLEGSGTPTFSLTTDLQFIEEGLQSHRIAHGGTPWWGGGVHWEATRDLSSWTTVWLSLRSSDPAFAKVQLHITGGDKTGIVETSNRGYANDGEWHHLAIPLADFAGVDWSKVSAPFVLVGGAGLGNEKLYVDNVYYSKD